MRILRCSMETETAGHNEGKKRRGTAAPAAGKKKQKKSTKKLPMNRSREWGGGDNLVNKRHHKGSLDIQRKGRLSEEKKKTTDNKKYGSFEGGRFGTRKQWKKAVIKSVEVLTERAHLPVGGGKWSWPRIGWRKKIPGQTRAEIERKLRGAGLEELSVKQRESGKTKRSGGKIKGGKGGRHRVRYKGVSKEQRIRRTL